MRRRRRWVVDRDMRMMTTMIDRAIGFSSRSTALLGDLVTASLFVEEPHLEDLDYRRGSRRVGGRDFGWHRCHMVVHRKCTSR